MRAVNDINTHILNEFFLHMPYFGVHSHIAITIISQKFQKLVVNY